MKHPFTLCLPIEAYQVYWDHIKGNKTKWIMSAMAAKFEQETGKSAKATIAGAKDRWETLLNGRGDVEL